MILENIKPCPFCGGRALLIVWKGEHDRMVRVECVECKCSTPGIVFQVPVSPLDHVREIGWQPGLEDAKRAAVEAWNQRTEAPEPQAVDSDTPRPHRRTSNGTVL